MIRIIASQALVSSDRAQVSGTLTVSGSDQALTLVSCSGQSSTYTGSGVFIYSFRVQPGINVIQIASTDNGVTSRLTRIADTGDKSPAQAYYGDRGPVLNDNASLGMATGTALLKANIYLLLATSRTERIMRAQYGTRLNELVFSSLDAQSLSSSASSLVSEALSGSGLGVSLSRLTATKTGSEVILVMDLSAAGSNFSMSLTYNK